MLGPVTRRIRIAVDAVMVLGFGGAVILNLWLLIVDRDWRSFGEAAVLLFVASPFTVDFRRIRRLG
jgi:hypothetical protein